MSERPRWERQSPSTPQFFRKNLQFSTISDYFPQSPLRAVPISQQRKYSEVGIYHSREQYEAQQKEARKRELAAEWSQQIRIKQESSQRLVLQKREEAERVKRETERILELSKIDRVLKTQRTDKYRRALDLQSGNAEKVTFQSNLQRFFGCEEASPSQDFPSAASQFFACDSQRESPSLSPQRKAKTHQKTLLSNPITGSMHTVSNARGRIMSLGCVKPVKVTGKVSESPPPNRAEWEECWGRVKRRQEYNPLTGEPAAGRSGAITPLSSGARSPSQQLRFAALHSIQRNPTHRQR